MLQYGQGVENTMEKTYYYDTDSRDRRSASQCMLDMIGLFYLKTLFDVDDVDKLPDSDSRKQFFQGKRGFAAHVGYAENMQESLIAIKNNWDYVKNTETAKTIRKFVNNLSIEATQYKRYTDFYASEQNNVFVKAERILAGLACSKPGASVNIYEINGRRYIFDDKKAAEELQEFSQKSNELFDPQQQ